ncbi:stage V sporulation protein AB [Peribacillus tepidiphilus]|uniref:stage V sporulation protein AB n=1 Tax=Peribacillus tepidiphilus TaxID=2652445 RepID=UPI0012921F40|nr:stage V sporulation protein AB [Peribacillus tepidiphilus]
MVINVLLLLFIGFAGGLAVGAGFVAFLTVLGVIPRLTQLTKTMKMIHYYELAVVAGAVLGGWLSFRNSILDLPVLLTIFIGLLSGVFNGMLAAALTEVLNVLPILAKRVGVQEKIIYLLMAIVLGKIGGSLFQWIYFVDK